MRRKTHLILRLDARDIFLGSKLWNEAVPASEFDSTDVRDIEAYRTAHTVYVEGVLVKDRDNMIDDTLIGPFNEGY